MAPQKNKARTSKTLKKPQPPTFNQLLCYSPAIKSILSHLDYNGLKNLSTTTKDWWNATHDEMVERSVLRLGLNRKYPERRYKTGSAYCTPSALQASSLPQNVPLEHITWDYGFIKADYFKLYPTLKSLKTKNCYIEDGVYDGLQHLSIFNQHEDFFGTDASGTYKDLVSFEYKTPSYMVSTTNPPQLCEFLVKHPGLRSFVLHVGSPDLDVFETLARCNLNLENLEIKSAAVPRLSVSFIQALTNLKSLKLLARCDNILDINLTNLHMFAMKGPISLTKTATNYWLPSSTKMQSFSLKFIDNDSHNILPLLAQRFTNLVELNLVAQHSALIEWDDGVQVTFPLLKSLKFIRISGLCKINAPELETLKVGGHELNDADIEHIEERFPKLKHFTYRRLKSVGMILGFMITMKSCKFFDFRFTSYEDDYFEGFLKAYCLDRNYNMTKVLHHYTKIPAKCALVVRVSRFDYGFENKITNQVYLCGFVHLVLWVFGSFQSGFIWQDPKCREYENLSIF